MASIESQIFASMKTILEELSWPKYVEYERIRQKLGDFRPHEIPAIQIYDGSATYARLQGRSDMTWFLIVEVVMKKTQDDLVDQGLLFDRLNEVETKIGENPQLGLTSLPATEGTMVSIVPIARATDLHMEDVFYTGNLSFQAEYLKPYSDIC